MGLLLISKCPLFHMHATINRYCVQTIRNPVEWGFQDYFIPVVYAKENKAHPTKLLKLRIRAPCSESFYLQVKTKKALTSNFVLFSQTIQKAECSHSN